MGYSQLANVHGGMTGARDQTGLVVEQGWHACGLPVTAETEADRSWSTLSAG